MLNKNIFEYIAISIKCVEPFVGDKIAKIIVRDNFDHYICIFAYVCVTSVTNRQFCE